MVEGLLPVRRADEVHEQLGQFLVVDRVVDGQRRDAGFAVGRGCCAGPRGRRPPANQTGSSAGITRARPAPVGDIPPQRIDQVGANLKIARVLRSACHRPGAVGRADDVAASPLPARSREAAAAWAWRICSNCVTSRPIVGLDSGAGERLEVGDEVVAPGQVGLGLLVSPRWTASSGRWKSRCSQLVTNLKPLAAA